MNAIVHAPNGVRPSKRPLGSPPGRRSLVGARPRTPQTGQAMLRVQAMVRDATCCRLAVVRHRAVRHVWQIAASRHPAPALPPPSAVWTTSYDLITDPFFDRGGLDKGLFWHLLASLQRVALGFAAVRPSLGVALGMLVGTSPVAMRGLDPIFQVLRTVPPLAWLPLSFGGVPRRAAQRHLRDLHHRDLARHHQHGGRRAQRAAGLP